MFELEFCSGEGELYGFDSPTRSITKIAAQIDTLSVPWPGFVCDSRQPIATTHWLGVVLTLGELSQGAVCLRSHEATVTLIS